jgi:hypothetical protein
MKIAEEVGDSEQKEKAKVNFGMANANLKWEKHQSEVLDKSKGEIVLKQQYNIGQIRISE